MPFGGHHKPEGRSSPVPTTPTVTQSREALRRLQDDANQSHRQMIAMDLLRAAKTDVDRANRSLAYYIGLAREHGLTWEHIGQVLTAPPSTERTKKEAGK